MKCKFIILGTEPLLEGALVIQDVGSDCRSVTNDAEAVVEALLEKEQLFPTQRLLYYDSCGELAEITHDGKRFIGFKVVLNARERFVAEQSRRLAENYYKAGLRIMKKDKPT